MDLKSYLSSKKITQEDFATRIGVEQSTVNQWLNGKRRPRDEHKVMIATATKGKVPASEWLPEVTQ